MHSTTSKYSLNTLFRPTVACSYLSLSFPQLHMFLCSSVGGNHIIIFFLIIQRRRQKLGGLSSYTPDQLLIQKLFVRLSMSGLLHYITIITFKSAFAFSLSKPVMKQICIIHRRLWTTLIICQFQQLFSVNACENGRKIVNLVQQLSYLLPWMI